MKRVFLCLIGALFLCLSPAPVFASSISAQSFILMDAATGAILSQKDAYARLPMASTTKIMTALVAIEHSDPTDIVTVPKEAAGTEGSSIYLFAGEKMTVRDLVFALLLESANDASVALAVHVAGSVDAFAGLMNEKAAELGLKNTHFTNPHGLPDQEHYSTAYDLARIMQAGLQNEFFRAVIATKNYTTSPVSEKDPPHYLRNHNRLLTSYANCIGGKTGFTKAAGRCLVSAAEQNGAVLIAVTLNAPNDWNDHKVLFNTGFSRYSSYTIAEVGTVSKEIPVVGGTAPSVLVQNTEPVVRFLQSMDGISVVYEVPQFFYAPVTGLDAIPKDAPVPAPPTPVGRAIFFQNGNELCSVDLYCATSVDAYTPKLTFWERILQFFGWNQSESKSS